LTITAKGRGYVYFYVLPKVKKNFNTVVLRPEQAASWSRCMASFWMLGSNISEVGWPKCGEIDILEYEKNQIWFYLFTLKTVTEILLIRKPDLITSRKVFMCTRWNGPKTKSIFFDDTLVYTFQPENKTDAIWPYNQPFILL
jgi:hypothetical protein